MKAVVVRNFGPPEVLAAEEVPEPRPADGQVVVDVAAIGPTQARHALPLPWASRVVHSAPRARYRSARRRPAR